VKCFQCERPAVGICGWCLLGQCEEPMLAGLEARRHIPTMGCIHQFTGENLRVGSSADSSAWRTS
jgi:hypothetical protein